MTHSLSVFAAVCLHPNTDGRKLTYLAFPWLATASILRASSS